MIPGRTDFQQTILGDDAGSRIARTLYLAGYERGIITGREAGYGEAMADFLVMAGLTARLRPSAPSWAELEAKRNTYTRPARTAEEIRAAAALSWGTERAA